MENVLIATALTFSIGALFQSIINVNAQQQQIVLINSSAPEQRKDDDLWFVILLILIGAAGLLYLMINS